VFDFQSICLVLFDLFLMRIYAKRCFWRSIIQPPVEEYFLTQRERYNLASPVEEKQAPRAAYVYSTVAASFAAPKYSA
jgi:hypothetical protein